MSSKLKRLGLYSAVLVVFFAALRVNPSRAEMSAEESQQLRELGQERFRQRDYEGAIEPTLKLHGAYPDNPIYMLQLAESYHGRVKRRSSGNSTSRFPRRRRTPVPPS